jgi:hypothetical protein
MTEDEKKAALAVGDIVEVTSPASASDGSGICFTRALAVVHEIRAWGVLACIPVPWTEPHAIIPMRLAWEDFDLTGGKVSLYPADETP